MVTDDLNNIQRELDELKTAQAAGIYGMYLYSKNVTQPASGFTTITFNWSSGNSSFFYCRNSGNSIAFYNVATQGKVILTLWDAVNTASTWQIITDAPGAWS